MHVKQILYQIATVPIPFANLYEKAQSYTKFKVIKPYIALNEETYISLRHQEIRNAKHKQNLLYIDCKFCLL